jgi:Protein of unknown function (DUF3631)
MRYDEALSIYIRKEPRAGEMQPATADFDAIRRAVEPYPDGGVRPGVADVAEVAAPRSANNPEDELPSGLQWKTTDDLLTHVERYIRSYVILGDAEAAALSLWVLHTYAIAAADMTPYIWVTSPEKRCGKTTLIDVLAGVARQPLQTSGITSAALQRVLGAEPTLFIDEADATFKGVDEYVEALRGTLNAGFKRGGVVHKVEGKPREVKAFPVFGPKVIAGIGGLPDTIADRSIKIDLKRKLPNESVRPARARFISESAKPIKLALEEWAKTLDSSSLITAHPSIPNVLSDRQADIWEPLIVIAEYAGGRWSTDARAAAVALSIQNEDESRGVTLLRDCFTILQGKSRLPSSELVRLLTQVEGSPWVYWLDHSGNVPENAKTKLAKRLKPFAIHSKQMKFGNNNLHGYETADFREAWTRYGISPGNAATSATSATGIPSCGTVA